MTTFNEEVIQIVRELPDSELHIYREGNNHFVTTEWLVGSFCGRAFEGPSLENATQQMISYFNRHLKSDSMVSDIVKQSGWPNLKKVKVYCESLHQDEGVMIDEMS